MSVVGMPPYLGYTQPGRQPIAPSTNPSGGGIDWGGILMGLGLLGQGVGGYFGARDQAQGQAADFAAQMARYNDLSRRVDGMTKTGPNQYSDMISQFFGFGSGGLAGQSIHGGPGAPGGGGGGAFRFSPMDAFLADISQVAPGSIPNVNAQQIDPASIGSEGFNAGQDGLMQMMRASLGDQRDNALGDHLNRFASGNTRFDTSGLMDAYRPIDQRNIDEQAAALHASAGSLGARFGTAMGDNERRLRQQHVENVGLRDQTFARDAFEAAQGRASGALGLMSGREQFFGNLNMQDLQRQQSAAASLQQGGLGISGLLAQLQQANAGNSLQAMLANQGMAGQTAFANQNALNTGRQFNARQGTETGQFNAQQGQIQNQMMLAAMGQAGGFQQSQDQHNLGLLGVLGGMQMPQQGQSPWPDYMSQMSQMLMMLPFLNQARRS